MAEPEHLILPLLREMQASIVSVDQMTARRFDLVEARLEKREETQRSLKQALSAYSLLSKRVTGEFEERFEARETRVRELEGLQ